MAEVDDHGGGGDGVLETLVVVGQEVRRSNPNAVAVDVVYVFATAFFATLAARGIEPALSAAYPPVESPAVPVWEIVGPTAIAALPLAVMLYFAWASSRLFLVANLGVISLTAAATWAGLVPL